MNEHFRRPAEKRSSTKALKAGFVDGFTASSDFFRPAKPTPTLKYQVTVRGAWEAVGSAFSEAMEREGVSGGKKSVKRHSSSSGRSAPRRQSR
jgi:hypothetical protein